MIDLHDTAAISHSHMIMKYIQQSCDSHMIMMYLIGKYLLQQSCDSHMIILIGNVI